MAFSKQHYIMIANILKRYSNKGIEELVNELVRVFKEDNPRFDQEKFIEASGFSGNSRIQYEEIVSSTGGKSAFKINEAFENVGMKLVPMIPITRLDSVKNLNEDLVGDIMAYEEGNLSDYKTLQLFSGLIKSGRINHMQGAYGRTAHALIQDGWLDTKGNITSKAKENGLKETYNSKKWKQGQMISKARANADPKDAYQQYLSNHKGAKAKSPPMTYDEWYAQWKSKKRDIKR